MKYNLTNTINDVLQERFQSDSALRLKKSNKPDLAVIIRVCHKDEVQDILELQRKVYDHITVKETFVFSNEEELAESLETDICIGAYHHNDLIGFTLMVSNPYSPRNLGFYLNYSQEQCLKCMTYDTTFVHPDYIGYGLQRFFISLKDAIAKSLGADEVLATVSPDNMTSLNNLKAGGFDIADEKQMYGALNRYIMRKFLV